MLVSLEFCGTGRLGRPTTVLRSERHRNQGHVEMAPEATRRWLPAMTAFLLLLAGMGQNPLAAQNATSQQMLSDSVFSAFALESPVLPAD